MNDELLDYHSALVIHHSPFTTKKIMFCQKCGTKNPDNGKFCRNCGTDLAAVSEPKSIELKSSDYYVDGRGRVRSNHPDDVWSVGIRNVILGIGFLIVSFALLTTGVAGGNNWWWAMLFPAFSMFASGISNIAKSKRIEKNKQPPQTQFEPPLFVQPQNNASLPPLQTEYIKPHKSIYDTGELAVPPSIVEGTTRHLEMNSEGDTMTLPKNQLNEKRKI